MVFVLVLAIGGHWVLLQSAAWVGMAVNFSKTDSLSVTLQKTFNGKHPCRVCKLVKDGKAAEKKEQQQKLGTKIDFHLLPGSSRLIPPSPARHLAPTASHAMARAEVPLLPPPRIG